MTEILKLKKVGLEKNAKAFPAILRAIVQTNARTRCGTASALTNNSGGTAGTINKAVTFVGAAASGSNLADKTTSEAAFTTVLDALGEVYAYANTLAALVGADLVTNSGGGAVPDGTIAAVTVAVTGATTGILVANSNVFLAALNASVYNAAVFVNKLCHATGNPSLTLNYNSTPLTVIPAITVSGGTAASPGVTQAEAQAALTVLRANIKTLAATLITIQSTTAPKIMATP